MKIQLMSDIHTEFHRDDGKSFFESTRAPADVLVLAGDIGTHRTLETVLPLVCDLYPHVIFVPGNHEYYESSYERIQARLLKVAEQKTNFHLLNDSSVEIQGQRFLGNTLWFPDTPPSRTFRGRMNDFRYIKDFEQWVYGQCEKTKSYLRDNIQPSDVVVTHYLPSRRCVSVQYETSPLNCFFVCDLDALIEAKKPKAWFFGHTHDSKDFMLHDTHLVCNPFGYAGHEENGGFNPHLIVKV